MSSVKGKLLICNRCGKTTFLRLLGKESFDGGYSSQDKFEEPPEGWKPWICIETYTTLCAECYSRWEKIRKNFFDEVEVKDEAV